MIGNILGVAGLVLTIAFGIYSIWVAKKTDKKVSLGLERKECYSLFKREISRLKIDIKYNNNSIDNYLILFKGVLINNGKTDIDKSRIYKPLHIKTKKEFKWLETNVYEKPNGSSVSFNKVNDTTIELSWDLLKTKEKIEFECLIEVPNSIVLDEISDNFYESLSFDFRITDINKIDKLSEINSSEKRKQKSKKMLLFMGIFTLIAGLYIFFSPDIPAKLALIKTKQEIEYCFSNNKDTVYTTINSKNDQTVVFKHNDVEVEKNIQDFNKSYDLIKINKTIREPDYFSRIMGVIYILTSFMSFFLYKVKYKKLPLTAVWLNGG